jgi:hypothetical protein
VRAAAPSKEEELADKLSKLIDRIVLEGKPADPRYWLFLRDKILL